MSSLRGCREGKVAVVSEGRYGKAALFISQTHLPNTRDMLCSQHTGEIDDGLHTLDLPLHDVIVIFLSSGREGQEMDGSGVLLDVWVGRGVWHETVVNVFGREGSEGGLYDVVRRK